MVDDRYSPSGRPSVDPLVFFKSNTFKIPSRKTHETQTVHRVTRREPLAAEDLDPLPSSEDAQLICANAAKSDWISKAGHQDREVKGNFYRRKADLFLSKTDPDASPMKRKGADHTHLGYQAHCVVDGGKGRIILGVLVAPFEVTENKPMLDMVWRAAFRWKSWLRRVTSDSAYGTVENISAIEQAGIRAYMALSRAPDRGAPSSAKTSSSPTSPDATFTSAR